jgi:Ca-activated chloride channel homolog
MKRNSSTTMIRFSGPVIILLVLGFLFPAPSFSQQEKKFIKDGNEQYKKEDYSAAEKQYSKALSKNKDSYKGAFNLGDAYYKQGKYEEAANQFQLLTHRATSKDTLAKAFHNLGNSLLKSKKYPESVDAYKNALKNNPNDQDTRYNLACAQQYLKQQQQQQQQQKDKKDDKKDQKKDKEKEKKEKEKEDKEKKDQNKNQDKKDKQEEQKNKISKEDAKRLLEALQNDEKDLQDKMKKGKTKGVKIEIEKDW